MSVAIDVLLAAGVIIAVAAAVGAVFTRDVYDRMHFLSPVTSVANPLIGLALILANGWGLTSAEIVATVVLLAVTGPVLQSATGRLAAQHDDLIDKEAPS